MSRELPARPHLDHLRKQARQHLRSRRRTHPEARLAESQRHTARQHGFANWTALKRHVESVRGAPAPPCAGTAIRSFEGGTTHADAVRGRCTERARQVLERSRCEARRYGSEYIEPEHVLLGLVSPRHAPPHGADHDLVDGLLALRAISLDGLWSAVDRRLREDAPNEDERAAGWPRRLAPLPPLPPACGRALTAIFKTRLQPAAAPAPPSPATSRLLARARKEANRLQHADLGSPHLLLGLLHLQDSPAATLLRTAGLCPGQVREDLRSVLQDGPGSRAWS